MLEKQTSELFVIMSENKLAKLVIQSKAIEIDTVVGHSSVHNAKNPYQFSDSENFKLKYLKDLSLCIHDSLSASPKLICPFYSY